MEPSAEKLYTETEYAKELLFCAERGIICLEYHRRHGVRKGNLAPLARPVTQSDPAPREPSKEEYHAALDRRIQEERDSGGRVRSLMIWRLQHHMSFWHGGGFPCD